MVRAAVVVQIISKALVFTGIASLYLPLFSHPIARTMNSDDDWKEAWARLTVEGIFERRQVIFARANEST